MEVIEIPFGAKDSELKGWEYTIPEGFTAEIKGGKVIVKEKESEDERIRKKILDIIRAAPFDEEKDILEAWLEKQKQIVQWPNLSNCKHDCKTCFAKCIYRKEQNEEQKPNIELIQRSWYMEGYHDGKFSNEPKWLIKTGEGGPKYEPNPKYGQPLTENPKPAEWSEEDRIVLLNTIIADVSRTLHSCGIGTDEHQIRSKAINFLKSLRLSWKPTEEQMGALSDTLAFIPDTFKPKCTLVTLQNDLKKQYGTA